MHPPEMRQTASHHKPNTLILLQLGGANGATKKVQTEKKYLI